MKIAVFQLFGHKSDVTTEDNVAIELDKTIHCRERETVSKVISSVVLRCGASLTYYVTPVYTAKIIIEGGS